MLGANALPVVCGTFSVSVQRDHGLQITLHPFATPVPNAQGLKTSLDMPLPASMVPEAHAESDNEP